MHEVFVRAAQMVRAETCVIAIQDYLGLGSEARVNEPAHLENNWHWRLKPGSLTEDLQKQIFELTRMYGRLNWESDWVKLVFEERMS
jgi:4-alpha-glucanotransferase